jgi:hypothetical protein
LRLGFIDKDLVRRNKEDFLKEKIPEEFKNEEDLYIDIKYETYEKKRMERISRALEVFY